MKQRRGEKDTNHRVSVSPRPRVAQSPRSRVAQSPRSRVPLITLLTDFGTADFFVGAVKGAILSINPNVRIVDLTHEIPPHDIQMGAFTLLAAYKSFPKGAIHVAIVDPGVGSSRRGICVAAGDQFFVGPDNGIFSYIYERELGYKVFELANRKYFHEKISSTFHGRDVFAPVAAALAKGVAPAEFGGEITNPVRLEPLAPEVMLRKKRGERAMKSGKRGGKSTTEVLRGRVIHVDRFGNCITNITPLELTPSLLEAGAHLVVSSRKITSFRNFFAENSDATSKKLHGRADLFAIWGSAGFLEIAATNRSAAKLLRVARGEEVLVKLGSDQR